MLLFCFDLKLMTLKVYNNKEEEKKIMNEKQLKWKSRTILFLISQCITLFGSTLVQMAIVWYVTIQTSSGVWVAAFTICSYLPQFLISFVAVSTLSSTLMIDIITAIAGVGLLSAVMIPGQAVYGEKVSVFVRINKEMR